ncbi:hypothetical protein L596_029464 [Steinernema carpocapsae]|uniref:Uncharacterized protein n=1 Tax=Steinernema carpocapsae TaxID=34508 RepID=A0A4U5LUQ7_STECR|nr:hypothetical protein L596_029464 [Steinernema carpocapsae]
MLFGYAACFIQSSLPRHLLIASPNSSHFQILISTYRLLSQIPFFIFPVLQLSYAATMFSERRCSIGFAANRPKTRRSNFCCASDTDYNLFLRETEGAETRKEGDNCDTSKTTYSGSQGLTYDSKMNQPDFKVPSTDDGMDCNMNPFALAEFFYKQQGVFGQADPSFKTKEFKPIHVAHFFPDGFYYFSVFPEEDLLQECQNLAEEFFEDLQELEDDGTRYAQFFEFCMEQSLILPCGPQGPETYPCQEEVGDDVSDQKSAFLAMWKRIQAQIPSREQIKEQNPTWSQEKLDLFESFKDPNAFFSLIQDPKQMKEILAQFGGKIMEEISEEDEGFSSCSEVA